MSVDSIGDFLTAIRNALMVSKRSVAVPFSNMKLCIAEILKEEGFIRDLQKVENEKNKPQLVVYFKYVDGESVIHEISRVSTPGRRVYESIKNVKPVVGGMGVSIISTSSGIMTDKSARKKSVGGEVICQVW